MEKTPLFQILGCSGGAEWALLGVAGHGLAGTLLMEGDWKPKKEIPGLGAYDINLKPQDVLSDLSKLR